MGHSGYFFRNSEVTLYGWMRKHFPVVQKWLKERLHEDQKETLHFFDRDPQISKWVVETVLKCGEMMPLEQDAYRFFKPKELDAIMTVLFVCNNHLPDEQSFFDSRGLKDFDRQEQCYAYMHDFYDLTNELFPHLGLKDWKVPNLFCRNYVLNEEHNFENNFLMGYWTPDECQAVYPFINNHLANPIDQRYFDCIDWMKDYCSKHRLSLGSNERLSDQIKERIDRVHFVSEILVANIEALEPGEGLMVWYSI